MEVTTHQVGLRFHHGNLLLQLSNTTIAVLQFVLRVSQRIDLILDCIILFLERKRAPSGSKWRHRCVEPMARCMNRHAATQYRPRYIQTDTHINTHKHTDTHARTRDCSNASFMRVSFFSFSKRSKCASKRLDSSLYFASIAS